MVADRSETLVESYVGNRMGDEAFKKGAMSEQSPRVVSCVMFFLAEDDYTIASIEVRKRNRIITCVQTKQKYEKFHLREVYLNSALDDRIS